MVILEVLNKANEGDIIFYLDAGCTVHTSSASKSRYLFHQNHIQEYGSLIFQQKYVERYWTKNEVVEHFHLGEDDLNSGQILGGIQGHLVNEDARRLVSQWAQSCTLDSGRLIRDVVSHINEDQRFIEHRHDQSIFSCLVKRNGIPIMRNAR